MLSHGLIEDSEVEGTGYGEFQGGISGASSFRWKSCQSIIPLNAFFIDGS